jgi:hypothetical protein
MAESTEMDVIGDDLRIARTDGSAVGKICRVTQTRASWHP